MQNNPSIEPDSNKPGRDHQTATPPAGHYMVRRNLEGFEYKPNPWRDARAWFVSSTLHTALFIVLGLFWQPARRGTGDLIDRPVGIAVFHETKNGELYELSDAGDAQANASRNAGQPQNQTSDSSSNAPAIAAPLDLAELTKDLIGYKAESGTVGAAIGKIGEGISGTGSKGNNGNQIGGSTTASFMGLKGTGSNFVYVLDRSASMEEFQGAPMRFAKSELLKSIDSLSDRNQFQIVFYNESPGSLSNGSSAGRLLAANEINKEKASRFVKAIKPSGGTEHIPGLKMALSFAPDVLFFLTDAAEPSLTEVQLIEIQSRAERSLTTIHTIQFNRGPAPNDGAWIRELAQRNRGTYRYIDISGLEQ
ncbi:MAG: hypothetical protein ACK5EO_06570 [Planctomycetota bacterium]|jgi:hypothetical protein